MASQQLLLTIVPCFVFKRPLSLLVHSMNNEEDKEFYIRRNQLDQIHLMLFPIEMGGILQLCISACVKLTLQWMRKSQNQFPGFIQENKNLRRPSQEGLNEGGPLTLLTFFSYLIEFCGLVWSFIISELEQNISLLFPQLSSVPNFQETCEHDSSCHIALQQLVLRGMLPLMQPYLRSRE